MMPIGMDTSKPTMLGEHIKPIRSQTMDPPDSPHEQIFKSVNGASEPATPMKEDPPVVSSPIPQRSMSHHPAQINTPKSSHFFLISAYEIILESKSIRRFPEIRGETVRALDLSKTEGFSKDRATLPHNINLVMHPFLLSCQSGSQTLTLIALDGLSKMIAYDYLSNESPTSNGSDSDSVSKERSPIEKAVLAICSCFIGESTDEKVQTQVIKGLMSAVSSVSYPIHQEALLNSIRTLYNIFLLSRDINNQIIAQGTLVQMSRSVFGRIALTSTKKGDQNDNNNENESRFSRSNSVKSKYNDDDSDTGKRYDKFDRENLSLEAIGGKAAEAAANAQIQGNICDSSSDLNVLDAFLLFRALCKLSIKPYQADGTSDVRCMSLRSKLLSLYLILTIINEFPLVFTQSSVFFLNPGNDDSPRKIREVTFLHAIKPYFCLSLSRNLVSNLPKVYELALAVFELVMTQMRRHLKREIEVFLKEIIIPILEMKPSNSQHQKHVMISMLLWRICNDPQILVEIYLNYDCDRRSLNNNIFERLTSALSKMVAATGTNDSDEVASFLWDEPDSFYISSDTMTRTDLVNLPPLTSDRFTGYFTSHSFFSRALFTDSNLQLRSLETLIGILKSLVQWSNKGLSFSEGMSVTPTPNGRSSGDDTRSELSQSAQSESTTVANFEPSSYAEGVDDPDQFEKSKIRKQAMQKCVDLFNRKPKKGIDALIEEGFISSSDPIDIAKFLLESQDLDKSMIGEYMGEGDQLNVSIMHFFVDLLDFSDQDFVAAMRSFLKKFRLPGEAQKIDRFMLKFAERFVEQNPNVFANADTAYVLAYSVIMLNTDLHNPQVKVRMTKEEFIKNNRGIDDNGDLPEDFLKDIYDQISSSEIKLKDEIAEEAPVIPTGPNLTPASLAAQFDILGAKQKKNEESAKANSQQMQTNAERYLKRLISRKTYKDDMGGMSIFYSASHFEHVRPMFEVSWMGFLAGISGPLKDTDDEDIVRLCLDGFRYSIHIAGFFDLDLARNAFVTTLSNFSFLTDITEMRTKNIDAIKTILDIAVTEGNFLKNAWNDILQVVNHLVRLQLVPNFSATTNGRDRSLVAHRDTQARTYTHIAMLEGNSQHMLIAVDKVFASSVYLNGPSIVDFVKALCAISWCELENMPNSFDRSKAKSSSKMFSIQKVVEIAYYNMNRIRLEWKEIWSILGPLFNQVGCHRNEAITSFAIDSLRQLSMKFLEKKELSHYQFQKDFLKPFLYIITNNPSTGIKDMVLQCINQMIKTHSSNIRSGWKSILEIIGRAAIDRDEEIVFQAFSMARNMVINSFEPVIIHPDIFGPYLVCLAQFAKNIDFKRINLQALETYKLTCDKMIEYAENNESLISSQTFVKEGTYGKAQEKFPELNYWIPIFNGLMEMVTEVFDLEVRTKAIDQMFVYLHEFGGGFPDEFWHLLLDDVLFPIFSSVGKLDSKVRLKFATKEDSLIFASSTMVQALRRFVDLFTEYFDKVFQYLDGLLDLLSVCLCQDNQTLCKIGADCLKLLVDKNVESLQKKDWERLLSIVIKLFKATSRVSGETISNLTIPNREKTNKALEEIEGFESATPLPLIPTTSGQQLNLCLAMISVVEDTFLQNDAVFAKLDPNHIFAILDLIEKSYLESQAINSQFDLKESIERQAVTKLQRFASTSLSLELNCLVCLIKVLLKMYISDADEYTPYRTDIEERLVPLCIDTFHQFNKLSEYPMVPGVQVIYELWHTVVLRVGNFLCKATGDEFRTVFAPVSSEIIMALKHRHLSHEVQDMLFNLMQRVNELYIQNNNETNETNSYSSAQSFDE